MRGLDRRRPQPGSSLHPVYSQDRLRERRRAGLPATYGGAFSLTDELAAIVYPLGTRVSRLPNPQACVGRVVDLAERTHELVSTVVGWLAEVDAQRRTEHLTDDRGRRAAAIRLLIDLAQRPALPDVGPDAICSGRWATDLVEITAPYTSPLSDLLGRSWPPGAPELRGLTSRSEKLCDLLHEVDTAARQLKIRVEKAESAAHRRPRSHTQTRADAARAQLRDLGVAIP